MTEGAIQVAEALASASRFLHACGVPEPRVDAELLLAHVLNLNRAMLFARDDRTLAPHDLQSFNRFVDRRGARREPLAYLTGRKEFYGVTLSVTPSVLIPRPSTETLVERAIALAPRRVLDLGTGSGAIVATLAANLPGTSFVATDVSPRAIAVARTNVPPGVDLRIGAGFEPVEGERFDLVVSNPPYIPSAEIDRLEPEVRHEPRDALDGGPDGLTVVRMILSRFRKHAERALVEIGPGQADVLRSEFPDVQFHKDLLGIDRVVEPC
ncbi:MAG: peptide chain release factor N(5)-glutamine methyltransferase [Planctomycetes bacterium]|nr:peptide chain release factor N(5)-glutamine methyltransferase [Planctomycetota bacterium]